MPRAASRRPDPAQLLLFEDEPSRRARIADRLKALLAPADPAAPGADSHLPEPPWPDSFFDTGHAPLE